MSMNHERVFKLVVKKDKVFLAEIKDAGDKPPSMFPDTLEKGMWCCAYAGWILGRYGVLPYMRKMEEWREL